MNARNGGNNKSDGGDKFKKHSANDDRNPKKSIICTSI